MFITKLKNKTMLKEIIIKNFVAIPCGLFFFLEEWYRTVLCLFLIIILDTVLGVLVAVKFKKFASYRLGRKAAWKFIRYGLAIMTIYLLSIADKKIFGWTFNYIVIFFILTEVVSNFEKLALLGLKIPTKLMSMLNDKYKELLNHQDTNEEKSTAKDIIESKECNEQ